MKITGRKILSLLLSICMVLTMLPMTALPIFAADGDTGTDGDFSYSVLSEADKTCEITGYRGAEPDLTIPSSLGGYTVTSIGYEAFAYCYSLTSVTIPNSVTSIGNGVFVGCSSLTEICVDLANTSYASEEGVLFNKDKTTLLQYPGGKRGAYTIPNSVISIGDGAFEWCSSLTSVAIPKSVTTIENYAFFNCYSLASVTIPEGVASIGDHAFVGCNSLTTVTIPNSVTTIGSNAFLKSTVLLVEHNSVAKRYAEDHVYCYIVITDKTNLEIQKELEQKVFEATFQIEPNSDGTTCTITKYTGIEAILTIPSSLCGYTVTSIGDSAFSNCSSLTSVTIPEGVTYIGNNAFYECYSLISATLPKSVTGIGINAFAYNYNITLLGYAGTETEEYATANQLRFRDIASLTSENIELLKIYGYETNPDGITCTITKYGGQEANLTIPSSLEGYTVTNIGYGAFDGCTSLISVTIPKGVTSIGDIAFEDCYNLTSVTIPESVTSIGSAAFYSCVSLTFVKISKNVKSIGDGAFAACTDLTEFVVDAANAQYTSEDGVLFTKDKTALLAYPGAKLDKTYAVPEGTKGVASFAFVCVGFLMQDVETEKPGLRENTLEHIIFPRSLELLAELSFFNCPCIQSYSFLSATTRIEESSISDEDLQATVYGYSGSTAETAFGTHFVPFETAQNPDGTTGVVDVLHHAFHPNTTVRSVLSKTSDNRVEYSLALEANRIPYQPSAPVEVFLPTPMNMIPEFINVYRKNDNGTYTDMHAQLAEMGQKLEFTTSKLGDFVLTTDFLDAKRGDISEDGNLNLTDYTNLRDIVADFNNDTLSRRENYIADVDGDGVVDAFDLAELNKLLPQ